MSGWEFWQRQLAGENPETTPGTPHAGFYTSGSAGAAYKRVRPVDYIAIWEEDGEWIARTDRANGTIKINRGWQVDEFVFSKCCRNAITHDTYIAKVKEIEDERRRVESAVDSAGLRDFESGASAPLDAVSSD